MTLSYGGGTGLSMVVVGEGADFAVNAGNGLPDL